MKTLIKVLDEQIERYQIMVDKKEEDYTFIGDLPPFEAYIEYLKPEQTILTQLSRIRRFIEPVTVWSEIPDADHGDVYSIEEFIEMCECGGFIDYDGFGYYCVDGKCSDVMIKPSDVKYGMVRKEFDSVCWIIDKLLL